MKKTLLPKTERERLHTLSRYAILDTLPEAEYDEITQLAAQICQTPASLISMVDDRRQWVKSRFGSDISENPREITFCNHTIKDPGSVLMINDTRRDDRFHDNPLVKGYPHIVFYAGVPLVAPNGYPVGTLCVIDQKPNSLTEEQLQALQFLSNQVVRLLELRKSKIELETLNRELETRNKNLSRFAEVAAHDIKSPLHGITMLANMLKNNYASYDIKQTEEFLDRINRSCRRLTSLIDGILVLSSNFDILQKNTEAIEIGPLIRDIGELVDTKRASVLYYSGDPLVIHANKTALERIFINLVSNSLQHSDKDRVEMEVGVSETDRHYCFSFRDNGPGIGQNALKNIFKAFDIAEEADRSEDPGRGIGLPTVKNLVEGLGGNIEVHAEPGKGTVFNFTIRKPAFG